MKEPIVFVLPNVEGEFHIIEKRGYTGKGYRYSLKYFLNYKEVYYCDSFKVNKTQLKQDKLIQLAVLHILDMDILKNIDLLEVK